MSACKVRQVRGIEIDDPDLEEEFGEYKGVSVTEGFVQPWQQASEWEWVMSAGRFSRGRHPNARGPRE